MFRIPAHPWRTVLVLAGLFVLLQIVPYGRQSNPPVVAEPHWDSPGTRELAQRACFDCHSNETIWPAYSRIAPASWLVARDVEKGRAAMNFSEWQRPQKEAHEAAEVVREGEMPMAIYVLMHPSVRLSTAERAALASGLGRTTGGEHAERPERQR